MERTIELQLILASGSPRRRELLALFGHPFAVHPADIDETMDPGKKPYDEVARLSREKALAVPREEGDAVIAADTVVVCDDRILGKPRSARTCKTEVFLRLGLRRWGGRLLPDRPAGPLPVERCWAEAGRLRFSSMALTPLPPRHRWPWWCLWKQRHPWQRLWKWCRWQRPWCTG